MGLSSLWPLSSIEMYFSLVPSMDAALTWLTLAARLAATSSEASLLAYGGEFTGWSGLAEAVARVEAQANSEPNRTTGLPPDALFMREKESLRPIGNLRLLESMVGDVSVQTVPPTMLVRAAGREWSVPRRCIGRRVSVVAMPGGQVVVRMAGEEVAVHDAASGPSRPINYDPDHYGQALEGKRGLADADIAEAARANLALLDSLGGA